MPSLEKNPQDIYYANGKETYAVYTKEGKHFTSAEVSLALERSVFQWNHEVMLEMIQNAFLISSNGVDFRRVNRSDVSISDPILADEDKKYLYSVVLQLPPETTHFKIMPRVDAAWAFFLTGVKLFGIDQTPKDFWTDSVKLKVNGEDANQLASGTVSTEWIVKQTGDSMISPVMVMAVYDANGRLKACSQAEKTSDSSGNMIFTASINHYTYVSDDWIKCVLFQSLNEIHPLLHAVTIE